MRKTGSTNHVRFTVSNIPRAETFYDPLLSFMGYELAEKSEERLAWKMPSPAGNRQWVIMSAASDEGRRKGHDRYSPGLHHFAWNAEGRSTASTCCSSSATLRCSIRQPSTATNRATTPCSSPTPTPSSSSSSTSRTTHEGSYSLHRRSGSELFSVRRQPLGPMAAGVLDAHPGYPAPVRPGILGL